ncbi:NAD(P)/FAD-dependent oxidoreductase [Haliovirga abyssi]|uniref:NAD(P)/FAD-dependent oxidoreductase n=1 Tax=Haliovirga abyssi TaxID=2996794 RepID=A0AAU9DK03_9FUSO|nr:FAD-dependent oxidoreductase [Haliovirga abyssi]BDU51224.1 hypothetical protein HLVA_17930 [Haliovirga abyssi]
MKKIIIIGNGIAGISAAETIRKKNKDYEIKLLSKENYNTYYRPTILRYVLEKEFKNKFYVKDEKWYKDNNVLNFTNTEVKKINKKDKNIELDNGEILKYDKLILATGSSSFIPPIKNKDIKNVHTLRTLDDVKNLKEDMLNSKKAVVIGGGVLGLEAAWGMKKFGLDVSIIEVASRIMPRQLDGKGSEILKAAIEKENIKTYIGDFIKEILGYEKVTGVKLDNGTIIDTDIVVISAGVRPNIELAKDAGLNTNRGIVVNGYMQTSDKDILAAGDCAEHNGKIAGIWIVGMKQGKIAGENIFEENIEYKEESQAINFSGINTKIYSIGKVLDDSEPDCEYKRYENREKNEYKNLYFEDDRVVGGIFVGDTKNSNKLMGCIKNKMTKEETIKLIFEK